LAFDYILDTLPSNKYTVFCTVKKGTSNFFRIAAQTVGEDAVFNVNTGVIESTSSNVTATIESLGDGWYKCIVVFNVATTGFFLQNFPVANGSNGSGSVYIYQAQANIGSTAKPYFPTTDRLNVPRLTYQNGGGGCPSLLLEKQSTNYALSSEDFSNTTYWTVSGNMTVTANQATSPDGTQNADLMYDSGARLKFVNSPVSSYYTFSCYFKRVDVQNVKITASDGVTGDVAATFDLINLTSSSSTSGDWSNKSTQITSVGNGWYRCSVTALRGSGGSQIGYRVECSESAKSFYAWGYQAEVGAYPTSYIPTTSASATRVADACFKTGISSLIGQTEGTMFIDLYIDELNVLADRGIMSVGVPGAGYTSAIYVSLYNSDIYYTCYVGGVPQITSLATTISVAGRYKIAVAYKQNDFVMYVNGQLIGTDTSGSLPSTLSVLGICNINQDFLGYHKVNEAFISKIRITNAELASLTTI
jgi:hypothetical protein